VRRAVGRWNDRTYHESVLEDRVDAENGWTGDGTPALSRRELEVLEVASHGETNAAIAARLGVSVHAVKFHLASIYKKLGVANRTEAAVWLLEHRAELSS
jgi:DNA-binding NarL/FixJ family response regulator